MFIFSAMLVPSEVKRLNLSMLLIVFLENSKILFGKYFVSSSAVKFGFFFDKIVVFSK